MKKWKIRKKFEWNVISYRNHAETKAEAVLALLKLNKKLLFPFIGESLCSSVISSYSVDSGLNQNESVFSILVFSAAFLHMSSDIYCLLNQTVHIFRNLRSATYIISNIPFFLSSLTIFCPVNSLMLGTAYLSLIATPIWDGDIPFLAIVVINYEMLLGEWATHLAHLLLKGVTVELIPFPFPFDWILPIINVDFNKKYYLIKIFFLDLYTSIFHIIHFFITLTNVKINWHRQTAQNNWWFLHLSRLRCPIGSRSFWRSLQRIL